MNLVELDQALRKSFGNSETPALLESVATALRNKQAVFQALNRPQDALVVRHVIICG